MTGSALNRGLVAFAGLMGAAGVVVGAAATHAGDPARLGPASSMLLFHAPAVLVTLLLVNRKIINAKTGVAAALGFAVGGALFSGNLVMLHYGGQALFPMAVPTGGILLILSWLVLAVAAIWPRRNN